MRISTPVTSRARKENTVSQCVTRTRRECRGLIVSAIRESVPMAHALCTGYPRNSRRNVPQCLVVLPVTWFPVFDFTGNAVIKRYWQLLTSAACHSNAEFIEDPHLTCLQRSREREKSCGNKTRLASV